MFKYYFAFRDGGVRLGVEIKHKHFVMIRVVITNSL